MPEEMLEKLPAQLRRAAMDLLARREHSKKELLDKLGKRFLTKIPRDHLSAFQEITREQIEQLASEGLQSDFRLAENFIRSRIGRGQGPLKIRLELRAKGIDEAVMDIAFEQTEVCWAELAESVLVKRFGNTACGDFKEKARRSRFLQQRGFSYDQFSGLLN